MRICKGGTKDGLRQNSNDAIHVGYYLTRFRALQACLRNAEALRGVLSASLEGSGSLELWLAKTVLVVPAIFSVTKLAWAQQESTVFTLPALAL